MEKENSLLPQERGALVCQELFLSRNDPTFFTLGQAGWSVAKLIENTPPSSPFPPQGRVNSRKDKQRTSVYEMVEEVAKQMKAAGKTPQQNGAVTAGLLGFEEK